jgi:hypothetical protein
MLRKFPARTRSTSLLQRQCEFLQIGPAEPFGVVGFQAMPLDVVLSESATASINWAGAQIGQRQGAKEKLSSKYGWRRKTS